MGARSSPCHACGQEELERLLDLGPLPIAHRFRRDADLGDEPRHPMVVDLCARCGLIQLADPLSPEELYRGYNFCFSSWKPQPHMRTEAELLRARVGSGQLVLEVGANDGTFLHVLGEAGFERRAGVEPNPLACAEARRTGATIHEGFFDEASAARIVAQGGRAACVASRQTIEHIRDLRGLLRAVARVLEPRGRLLIEVPDFEVALDYGDPSFLWEEHVNYFGEDVLCGLLEAHGYEVEEVARYPFSGGALMVLARADAGRPAPARPLARWLERARAFPGKVATLRARLRERLERNRADGRPSVLYGSGCRANTLVNAFGLAPYLSLLVDDQQEKQGLYLPGTALRVEPSQRVMEQVGDCFLSVNHENEEKVISRHAAYAARGGRFSSLNAPSPLLVGS